MRRLLLIWLSCSACAAAAAPATQPARVSLHFKNAPVKAVLEELAKQAGVPIPLSPPELLERTPPPAITLDLDRVPFWSALEEVSRKTGLEPRVSPDEPYPRFQLGLGGQGFWTEPHVVAGPLVLFANEVERSNTAELGKTKHTIERELTINLTAFAEPGLTLLGAAQDVKVLSAVDEKGRSLKPSDENSDDVAPQHAPGISLYSWELSIDLGDVDAASQKITGLKGRTSVRVQTAGERLEIEDVLKARNVTRIVAGAPFIFKSLKKVDIEYILQINLRRDKKSEREWKDLWQSIYNGHLALYDKEGRLVAARATENGGEYANHKIDATLRFVREPGVTDPGAGEPFKLVWIAPTAGKDLPIEFELTDLPLPQ